MPPPPPLHDNPIGTIANESINPRTPSLRMSILPAAAPPPRRYAQRDPDRAERIHTFEAIVRIPTMVCHSPRILCRLPLKPQNCTRWWLEPYNGAVFRVLRRLNTLSDNGRDPSPEQFD